MKKILSVFIIVTTVFCMFGCKAKTADKQADIYFPSQADVTQSMDASMKAYKDTKQLYDEALHIVVGTVTEADRTSDKTEHVPIVISSLKIEKVLKGELTAGDVINIHETGERNPNGDWSIGGVPLLKKNMKVLLYLNEGTDYYIGEHSFGICGVYFGKFFYDKDGEIHSAVDFVTDVVTKLSDFTEPMKEAEVLSAISKLSQ